MYMLAYTHTLYVHACIYKLGGVLDKLCAFPADEGYNNILTSLKRLSRIQGLAWPHHDYFAMYIHTYMYMYNIHSRGSICVVK